MKFIGRALYTILILVLLAVAGVFLASMFPVPGHIAIKIVKSGSMEPAMHVGSIVVIKPEDMYAVGDVITFGEDTRTQIPTTHRIKEIGSENGSTIFTTKGDANEDPDPTRTPIGEVRGKMLFTVPYAGYVLDFAKRPLGFGLMIALPAGIIILDEIIRIISEVQKMRTDKKTSIRRRQEDEEPDSPVVTMHDLRTEPPMQSPLKNPTHAQRVNGRSIDGVSFYHYD